MSQTDAIYISNVKTPARGLQDFQINLCQILLSLVKTHFII